MTPTKSAMMPEDTTDGIGRRIGQVALLVGTSLVALFAIGVFIGILAAHAERGGGPLSGRLIAVLAGAALLAAASAYGGYRAARALGNQGDVTARERRGRVILLICGGLGGLMGLALALAGDAPFSAFSDAPLPAALAIVLALTVAVLLPIASVYWHRKVADEQDAAAYSKGALWGVYVFWVGAPTWWLLYRGGLVPAPDGVLIYLVTIAVAAVVWLWAKYR